jgi:hypothetical protein
VSLQLERAFSLQDDIDNRTKRYILQMRCLAVTYAMSPLVLSDAFESRMYGLDITNRPSCCAMDPACPHDIALDRGATDNCVRVVSYLSSVTPHVSVESSRNINLFFITSLFPSFYIVRRTGSRNYFSGISSNRCVITDFKCSR